VNIITATFGEGRLDIDLYVISDSEITIIGELRVGGRAEKKGLKINDQLYKVNGINVYKNSDAIVIIKKAQHDGDYPLTLVFYRPQCVTHSQLRDDYEEAPCVTHSQLRDDYEEAPVFPSVREGTKEQTQHQNQNRDPTSLLPSTASRGLTSETFKNRPQSNFRMKGRLLKKSAYWPHGWTARDVLLHSSGTLMYFDTADTPWKLRFGQCDISTCGIDLINDRITHDLEYYSTIAPKGTLDITHWTNVTLIDTSRPLQSCLQPSPSHAETYARTGLLVTGISSKASAEWVLDCGLHERAQMWFLKIDDMVKRLRNHRFTPMDAIDPSDMQPTQVAEFFEFIGLPNTTQQLIIEKELNGCTLTKMDPSNLSDFGIMDSKQQEMVMNRWLAYTEQLSRLSHMKNRKALEHEATHS